MFLDYFCFALFFNLASVVYKSGLYLFMTTIENRVLNLGFRKFMWNSCHLRQYRQEIHQIAVHLMTSSQDHAFEIS